MDSQHRHVVAEGLAAGRRGEDDDVLAAGRPDIEAEMTTCLPPEAAAAMASPSGCTAS
jgi:hypothetical protein